VNSSPAILVLGANSSAVKAIKDIRSSGIRVYAADANPDSPGFQDANESFVIDITNPSEVAMLARAQKVRGVMPLNDFSVRSAFWANQSLGLTGPVVLQGIFGTSKSVMRRVCREWGVPQPIFNSVTSPYLAQIICEKMVAPFVIKPSHSGGGGRGVSIVMKPDEVSNAIEQAFLHTLDGEIMVEQFVEGVEITADLIVQHGVTKARVIGEKVRTEGTLHVAKEISFPANLSSAETHSVDLTLQKLVESSGVNAGMLHAELIVRPDGAEAVLVELGLRGGGGEIFGSIMEKVIGVSAPIVLAQIYCGLNPDINPEELGGACYRFLFPSNWGTVRSISLRSDLNHKREHINYGLLSPTPKEYKGLKNSLDRVAFLTTWAESREEARKLADEVEIGIEFHSGK